MNEKISIVVPVYKVEKYINRCVESLVNQTYKNIEVILVDDGSPDNCPFICDTWSKKDSRIKTIHQKNGGLSVARNRGIIEATGTYLLFVDSDDYLELDACEKLYELILETEADFVVGVIREIRKNTVSYQSRTYIRNGETLSYTDFIIKSIDANEWYAPAVLNLYSIRFLRNNNLYFKKDILHEDMDFLPKLYLSANKISYINYAFYNYEIREDSITTSKNYDKKINSVISIYNNWKVLFDNISHFKLQQRLYGFLVRCYLKNCRSYGIDSWLIDGVDFKFAFTNALNLKERLKVVMFSIAPRLYTKL